MSSHLTYKQHGSDDHVLMHILNENIDDVFHDINEDFVI